MLRPEQSATARLRLESQPVITSLVLTRTNIPRGVPIPGGIFLYPWGRPYSGGVLRAGASPKTAAVRHARDSTERG